MLIVDILSKVESTEGVDIIGFSNPKHLNKISQYWVHTKGDRINSENK